jgi:phosphate-selective porin OprO/OprP
VRVSLGIAVLVAGVAVARGQDAGSLRELQERVEALEKQLRQVQQDKKGADGKPDKEEKPAEEGKKEGDAKANGEEKDQQPRWYEVGKELKLSAAWTNGFVAETADQAFRVHVGGRADFDNNWYTQDPNLLLGSAAGVRTSDGSLFRRARLRVDGTMWEQMDFVAEVNFANVQDASNVNDQLVQIGSVGLTDFFLNFRDVPWVGNVRVGHFLAPVGLERLTSSNAWYYMERSSLYDAFLNPNNYQDGVELYNTYLDDHVYAAAAATRIGSATVNSFGFDADDGAYGASGRVAVLPVYEDEGRLLMHLGLGFQHQALVGHTLDVASRPLLRAGSGRNNDTPNLLSTGNFFSPDGGNVLDAECAFVCGPWSLSGEYALAWGTNLFSSYNGLVFSGPRGDVAYQAFYVEGGWFLTPGDHRRWDRKEATWARTVPQENAFFLRGEDGQYCHGCGAVQLVARYTCLDLTAGSPVLSPKSGGARAGIQQDVTVGLNWYLNPQVVVMLNGVWTHLSSEVPGASGDLQYAGVRFHFDF